MWLMLQQKEADDYVIATGESHSVKELVEIPPSMSHDHWHPPTPLAGWMGWSRVSAAVAAS